MAPIPLTEEQATELYNRGQYSDATYNQVLAQIRANANPPVPTPTPMQQSAPVAPTTAPPLPAAEPTPIAAAIPAPAVNIPDAEPAPAPQAAAPGTLTTDQAQSTAQPGAKSAISSDYDTAFTNQALGVKNQVDAAQKEADIKSAGLQREADNMAAYQAQNQKRDLEAKAQLDDFQKQYQDAILAATSAKIDPNRYWADKTTGQKILARIAIALGGVGAALRNSDNKNHVLEMIQKDIDNDIDAQKEQLQKNFQAATAKGTLYAMMKGRFDDDRQATLAAQAAGLKIAEVRMSAALSQVGGDTAKANGLDLIGKLQEKQADKEKELLALKGNQISVDQMDQAARAKGADEVFSMLQDRDPKILDRFFKANVTVGYDKDRKPITKTVAGLGSNGPLVGDTLRGQDAYEAMMATLNQIASLRAEHGVEANITTSTARAQAAKLQTEFTSQYKEAQKLGALDNGVLRLTGSLIPEDPLGSKHFIDPFGITERIKLALGGADSTAVGIRQLQDDFAKAHNKALQTHITHFFPGLGVEDPSSAVNSGRVKY